MLDQALSLLDETDNVPVGSGFTKSERAARKASRKIQKLRLKAKILAAAAGANVPDEKPRKKSTVLDDNNDDNIDVPYTINGEWDTQGRHYTPAGGGNAWRDDGTLMQKAAGGYIDTTTGQFVPAN